MIVLDPGHIYRLQLGCPDTTLTFIKRSGGAITYKKEWPGIQTQALMRALITHLGILQDDEDYTSTYNLWQLGDTNTFPFKIYGFHHVEEIIDVLIDRTWYLNNILPCVESRDANAFLIYAKSYINRSFCDIDDPFVEYSIEDIRNALWCYEARAWRRKVEKVNRKKPAHDDSERLRDWRENPANDVPFGAFEIELRPIGPDGHIVKDW